MSDTPKPMTPTMYLYRNAGSPGQAVTGVAKEFKALNEKDQADLVAWSIAEMNHLGLPISEGAA